MAIQGAGFGIGTRLSLIDLKSNKVSHSVSTPDWNAASHKASEENWKALGLIPSDVPGPNSGFLDMVRARMGLQYRLTINNPDGSIRDTGWRDSDSLTINWIRMFRTQWGNTSDTLTDSVGNARVVSHSPNNMNAVTPGTVSGPVVGDDSLGQVLGAGQTAVTVDDTKLVSLIDDGSGPGELTYTPTIVNTETQSGIEARVTLVRSFTNNTGVDVLVREVGLHLEALGFTFLVARDLTLSDPETIVPLATATLAWKIFTADIGNNQLFRGLFQLLNRDTAGRIYQTNLILRQVIFPDTVFLQATEIGENIVQGGEIDARGDRLGIQVGRGADPLPGPAFDPSDEEIFQRIPDGSSLDELEHGPQVTGSVFTDAGNRRFLMSRSFVNFSGLTITVREAGQYWEGKSPGNVLVAILGTRFIVTDFAVPDSSIVVIEFQYQV